MTTNQTPGPPVPAVDLARAGFDQVVAGIQARLAHDLNGRAASLIGILELLRDAGAPAEPLGYLDDEIARLEDLARLLGTLPRNLGAEAEALVPRELGAVALDVAARVRGLEDTPMDNGLDAALPPILAGRSRLLAALLVLIHRAHGRRSPEDRHEAVVLEGADEGGAVAFRVAGDAGPDDPDDAERLAAIGAVLAGDGGEVRLEPGQAPALRVPTLRAARAAERARAGS